MRLLIFAPFILIATGSAQADWMALASCKDGSYGYAFGSSKKVASSGALRDCQAGDSKSCCKSDVSMGGIKHGQKVCWIFMNAPNNSSSGSGFGASFTEAEEMAEVNCALDNTNPNKACEKILSRCMRY